MIRCLSEVERVSMQDADILRAHIIQAVKRAVKRKRGSVRNFNNLQNPNHPAILRFLEQLTYPVEGHRSLLMSFWSNVLMVTGLGAYLMALYAFGLDFWFGVVEPTYCRPTTSIAWGPVLHNPTLILLDTNY